MSMVIVNPSATNRNMLSFSTSKYLNFQMLSYLLFFFSHHLHSFFQKGIISCEIYSNFFFVLFFLMNTYAHAYFDAFRLPVNNGDNSARSLMSVLTLSASPVK